MNDQVNERKEEDKTLKIQDFEKAKVDESSPLNKAGNHLRKTGKSNEKFKRILSSKLGRKMRRVYNSKINIQNLLSPQQRSIISKRRKIRHKSIVKSHTLNNSRNLGLQRRGNTYLSQREKSSS